MLRWLVLIAVMVLAVPAMAQDRAQTLADIKLELSALMAEFNALKQELVTSGATTDGTAGGDALQRLDAIEAELVRLTAKTEEVELKVNRVVTDGTNRIGDMEFRLCDVTEGCDVNALPDTTELGAEANVTAPPATDTPTTTDPATAPGGAEMAMSEQADFDRAKEVLGTGDFRTAADLFATFAQSYPGGPLNDEAQLLRGDALNQMGQTADAARAFLDSFSGKPEGPLASQALFKLGQALGTLGQVPEACTTLNEVGVRFPGSTDAAAAVTAMQGLGCQ